MPNKNNGPLAFYFLNHFFEEKEISRQLQEMKTQGFGGVFLHPRAGNLVPYLTDMWFKKINYAVGECIRLGLEPWLYDEEPFPSGAAGGLVCMQRPDLRAQVLRCETRDISSRKIDVELPQGNLIAVYGILSSEKNNSPWINLMPDTGPIRKTWSEMGILSKAYYPLYAGSIIPHYRAQCYGTVYRVFHEAVESVKAVVAVYADYFSGGVWDTYPDLMNREATDLFIQLTHKQYRSRIKKEYWRHIPGIFLDEAKIMWPFAWTENLPVRYAQEYNEPLLEYLPHLFKDYNEYSSVVRSRYRDITGILFTENFLQPINEWCRKNNILFTGHISPEEEPVCQQMFTPGLLRMLRSFGQTGVDIVSSLHGSVRFPAMNIGVKIGESVCSQKGERDYLIEALGVSGENLDGERMRQILDWCFSFGINRICIHGQYYSLDGSRKREAPPSIFYQQPYWQFFQSLSRYINCMSTLLRKCREKKYAGYLYPTSFFGSKTLPDLLTKQEDMHFYREVEQIGRDIIRFGEIGMHFDFIDENDLIQAQKTRKKSCKLRIGKAGYRVLLVPDVPSISAPCALAITNLIADGFPVIPLGRIPEIFASSNNSISGLFRNKNNAENLNIKQFRNFHTGNIRLRCPTVSSDGVTVRELVHQGKEYLYFYNQNISEKTVNLEYSETRNVELLCPNSTEFIPLRKENEFYSITIPGLHGALVREGARRSADKVIKKKTVIDISHGWTVQRMKPNFFPVKYWDVYIDNKLSGKITTPEKWKFKTVKIRDAAVLRYQGTFNLHTILKPILLIADRELVDSFIFHVNGNKISKFHQKCIFDESNYVVQLKNELRSGNNIMELSRHITKHSEGVCLRDCVYLAGEFTVKTGTPGNILDPDHSQIQKASLKDWKEYGWPFYSGVVRYVNIFFLAEKPSGDSILRLKYPGSFAKVRVNKKWYDLFTKPYEVCVSDALQEGKNEVEILSANTIQNIVESKPCGGGVKGPVELDLITSSFRAT